MLLKSMAKNNDIVNIHNAAFCDEISQYIIHRLLKCYGAVFEAKGEAIPGELTTSCDERSFVLSGWVHSDLPETRR